jgi:hypothetical protein
MYNRCRARGRSKQGHVLQEPGRGEIAFQAVTSPFALGVIRDLDPQEKTFSFEVKLDWEVVHVGG